jgi:hypothetical protein
MTGLVLARARLRRLHADGEQERGFALLFVLGITTMIAVLVGTALVVTASSIVPAVQSAYSQAADAAAQSGVQAFVAYLDAECPSASTPAECALTANLSNDSGTVSIPVPGADSSYTATYRWHAYRSTNYFRVVSLGSVHEGGVAASRTVIGDVVPGATRDLLKYGMVTGFETESSATALTDFQEHTIALDSTAINAASVPIKGGKIHWGAASGGTAAGKTAVCNATFDAKGGRGNNPPPNAPNPYVDFTVSGLNGNNYTDYEPCHTSWGAYTKLIAPAHNATSNPGGYYSNDALLLSNSYPGGAGPDFDQPVYTGWQYSSSADAGQCSTAAGQNYRSFNLVCAGYPVEVGGAPSDGSLYPNVQYQDLAQGPQIPTSSPTIPNNACVYAGPTRIKFNNDDAHATVTSPMTTSSWVTSWLAAHPAAPAACYSGAGATGMAAATVNFSGISVVRVADNGNVPSTTPASAHGSSGWPVTGQKLGDTPSTSNSVFYLTSGTSGTVVGTPSYTNTATDAAYVPATNDNPSTKSDGAWVPQWTSYTNNGSCDATTGGANFKLFNCYVPKGSSADPYSWVKAQVKAAIAANPGNYTTTAQLQTLVNSLVSQGNSSDGNNAAPSHADSTSHKWSVAVAQGSGNGCTQATGVAGTATDTPISAPTNDSMFSNAAGNVHAAPSTDTTCFTATVTLQVGTCNVALVLGVCVNVGNYVWGNGTALLGGGQKIAQFTATFTVKKTTVTTTTTAARSSFPAMNDVTQYQMGFDNGGQGGDNTFGANGPGDLYVEGKVQHTMALVADDDVIITGSLGPSDADLSTSNSNQPNPETATDSDPASALEIVGRNNVRVYHPVKCRITDATAIAATSAGFCPDDITGLYSNVPATANRPDQQYVNLRSDLAGMTIYGAIFALGNAAGHLTCPQPPNGGGVCGGEFSADNHNRGDSLGYLTVVGTLGMAHHSPVGEEWPINDALGATSRPYSGYQMAQQYLDLSDRISSDTGFPNPLDTTSTTPALWHILSISTGTPS